MAQPVALWVRLVAGQARPVASQTVVRLENCFQSQPELPTVVLAQLMRRVWAARACQTLQGCEVLLHSPRAQLSDPKAP